MKKKPLFLNKLKELEIEWAEKKKLRDKLNNSNLCEKCKYFNEINERCNEGYEIEKISVKILDSDFIFVFEGNCNYLHYLN